MRRGNNRYLRRLVDEVDDDAGDIDRARSRRVMAKVEEFIRGVGRSIGIHIVNNFIKRYSIIRFFNNRSVR